MLTNIKKTKKTELNPKYLINEQRIHRGMAFNIIIYNSFGALIT